MSGGKAIKREPLGNGERPEESPRRTPLLGNVPGVAEATPLMDPWSAGKSACHRGRTPRTGSSMGVGPQWQRVMTFEGTSRNGGGRLRRHGTGRGSIANKYREGKVKRTLRRESKVRETVSREADPPVAAWRPSLTLTRWRLDVPRGGQFRRRSYTRVLHGVIISEEVLSVVLGLGSYHPPDLYDLRVNERIWPV